MPSAAPVSALVHPWQVPVQAASQHTPSAQKPVAHWSGSVHGVPPALVCAQVPPLFVASQNWPDAHWLSMLQAAHVLPVQYPLRQSLGPLHPRVLPQGEHDPPQSRPVSSPSCTMSMQCCGTQVPAASQTTPPLSLHVVPLGCIVLEHVFEDVQATTSHAVVLGAQSLVFTHAMQWPPPSQTLPPPSLHVVSAAAFLGMQAPPTHCAVAHLVPVGAQSASCWQATQWPMSSQPWPPLSLHVEPAVTFVVPQTPAVQDCCWHIVDGVGHSLGTRHSTHLPLPSQCCPPLKEHLVSCASGVNPQHPATQAASAHSPAGVGQFAAEAQGMQVIDPPVPGPLELPPVLGPLKSKPPRTVVQALMLAIERATARHAKRALFIQISGGHSPAS